jgi:hypothetical protein
MQAKHEQERNKAIRRSLWVENWGARILAVALIVGLLLYWLGAF